MMEEEKTNEKEEVEIEVAETGEDSKPTTSGISNHVKSRTDLFLWIILALMAHTIWGILIKSMMHNAACYRHVSSPSTALASPL